MTTKDVFTLEEWALLKQTLYEPGIAVIIAAPGGILREVFAIISGSLEAAQKFAGSELVQALLDDTERNAAEEEAQAQSSSVTKPIEDLMANTIAHVRQAVKIVSEKATPQELEDYKELVMFLAEKVANAASEGGVLGVGGEQVTQEEQRVLDELKLALRRKA